MELEYTETSTKKHKIQVAPCIKCGSEDIRIFDYGYWEGNSGGGECKNKKCKHHVTSCVSYNVTIPQCAAIWNAGNDINLLILAEEEKIRKANEQIQVLKQIKKDRDD